MDPPKRLFLGGFGISFLCRAKANLHRGRRLGIWGVDCARVQAMVPPKLCRENAMCSGRNAKTTKQPVNSCVAVPSENCTTKIAEFRFVAGSG